MAGDFGGNAAGFGDRLRAIGKSIVEPLVGAMDRKSLGKGWPWPGFAAKAATVSGSKAIQLAS